MDNECEDIMETKGFGWKVSLSIIICVGWLVFLILWLAFFASEVDPWERNISIILSSILVAFLLLGGSWAVWAFRKIPKEGREMLKIAGFKWRIGVSIILPFLAIIFLIYWFWFYYKYEIWQHIAVILVTILVTGGILGVIWAKWGMKHHHKFEHEHLKDIEEEIEKRKNEEKGEE